MQALHPTASDLQSARVRRYGRAYADLNARIARLALLLGAPLANEHDIQMIVQRQAPNFKGHVSGDPAHPGATGRRAQQWDELRGLLVLRCNMMAGMLNDLGLELTEQVVWQAEEHLVRVGFKRGADGFDLLPHREP